MNVVVLMTIIALFSLFFHYTLFFVYYFFDKRATRRQASPNCFHDNSVGRVLDQRPKNCRFDSAYSTSEITTTCFTGKTFF